MHSEHEAAAHHLVGSGEVRYGQAAVDILESRVLQGIASEDWPRLDVRLFQVGCELESCERRRVANDERHSEPDRISFRKLRRQDEVWPLQQVFAQFGEMRATQVGKFIQALELYAAESSRHFQGEEVVADFREEELPVIRHVAEHHVEAIFRLLRFAAFAKQRRLTTPAAQYEQALSPLVVVHHDHPAAAGAVDDVRAVEARGSDVAEGPGRLTIPATADGVTRVFDEDQVVTRGDVGKCFQVRKIAEQRRNKQRLGLWANGRFDVFRADDEGLRVDVDEHRYVAFLDDRRDDGSEGEQRSDHLVTRTAANEFHCEQVGRGAGVDHDAVFLAEAVSDRAFEG